MPVCIFEDHFYQQLTPLSLTRPVFDLRCGITSLKEKIIRQFPNSTIYLICRDYLKEVVSEENPNIRINEFVDDKCFFINGRVLADDNLSVLMQIQGEQLFLNEGQIVAAILKGSSILNVNLQAAKIFETDELRHINQSEIDAKMILYPWDLINNNASEINKDFQFLNRGGEILGAVSEHAILINQTQLFIGANSKIKAGVVLDAENGPIYIGENVTVMTNAVIEGPAFIGDNSTIKIGAKIYEGTSIGEVCKVGGEVEGSIIHSHSNKQHEGFLGHAYLGQWVNLGADTNNSDLKNNYGSVKVNLGGTWVDSESQFVGLFMGDHSKAGINTMFNTGTVVGVMSNVFGGGFPPKFVPSFSWGGADGFVEHQFDKAVQTAEKVMSRRNVQITVAQKDLFKKVHKLTNPKRNDFLNSFSP